MVSKKEKRKKASRTLKYIPISMNQHHQIERSANIVP
jgi:hypothetical protein